METTRKHPLIDRYLKKLIKELRHLSPADREEIRREIEEHIIEKWENDSAGKFDEASLSGVLGKLGTPEFLASQYCAERGWARPPVKHTVRNVTLAVFAFVFISAAALTYVGIRYIFYPIKNAFSGDVVDISEKGVKILNGAISVSDSGVKVKGIVDIKANEGSNDDDSSVKVKIDGENSRVDIDVKDDDDDSASINKLFKQKPIASESGELTIPASGVSKFKTDIANARINIKGTDSNEVKVKFTKKVYGKDAKVAEEVLKNVSIAQSKNGDNLTVENKDPYSAQLPSKIDAIAFDVEITMPKNLGTTIDEKYGSVTVDNLKGPLAVDAKYSPTIISNIDGDISIDSKFAPINVQKINGSASISTKYSKVDIANIAKDIKIDTKYGNANITVPKDFGFTLSANQKYGRLSGDFPMQKEGPTTKATVGNGVHKIEIEGKYTNVKIERK